MDVSKITGNAHYFKDMPNPKLDEVKVLLDNNAPAQKLEGMKRLIAMISKGKDVSNLFPEVVKNVVCPNVEVKKLVYMYLIHYAEFQQDAALLAINTFQKDLDNPNQLIRAQALRVMSSIRLKVIVQIIQLAIKKCVTDSSPYVRKMAAHAITKVYSLDLAMKEELIECIDTLLGDNTTLVLGSAIGAFSIVCPERYDLIHGHFRKICNMLADTDEWGQVNIINLLTRYIRHHFVDPNPDATKKKPRTPTKKKKKEGFYSDSDSGSESSSEEEDDYDKNYEPEMDPDHRLALRAAAPLLQSRNSAVVVAVAQLFLYCAPETEAIKVGKSLVRCCRNHREIQFIVLQNVATMAVARPEMFAPYLTEFFIEETDPVYIRNLKLEIITCLASEGNISRILREFTFYVHREEKKFVRNVIQAIVRCASQLQEVQDTCMQGLLSLITNDSEVVVAESVVAIKKLLQMGAGEHDGVVKSLVKLLDNITVPAARASIVWCAGEYAEKIPKLAPDILRKLAKTFSDEDTTVKIQVLNLAAKLILHNPQQTHLIVQYVLNMAKYDMSYDLRDRARVYRGLLLRPGAPLTPFARRLILTEKPSPEDIQPSAERSKWAIGSMSQLVGHTVAGYLEIGEWAEVAADPAPRSVIPKKQRKDFVGMGSDSFRSSASHSSGGGATFGGPPTAAPAWARASTGSTASSFYDDESDEDASYTGSDDYSDEEGSYSDSYSDYSDEYSDESDEDDRRGGRRGGKGRAAPAAAAAPAPAAAAGGASLASFFGGAPAAAAPPAAASSAAAFFGFAPPSASASAPVPVAAASPASLLNEFAGFGISSGSPAMVPSSAPAGSLFGSPSLSSSSSSSSGLLSLNASAFSGAPERPREVLLKRVVGNGLQIEYQFQRRASIHGADVSVIQLWFSNHSDGPLTNIRLGEKEWPEDGATIYPFDVIPLIPAGGNCEGPFNIKFTSLTKAVRFQISVGDQFGQSYSVQITPPVGELIKAVPLGHPGEFEELQKKMGGLNESTGTVSVPGPSVSKVGENILAAANLATIEYNEGAGVYKFSGRSLLGNEQILIDVAVDDDGKAKCKVNCDNAILGNMLLTRIKTALSKS